MWNTLGVLCKLGLNGGSQVVVNYASSAGAAEEVAEQIKASGGDAIVVGANLAKAEDIERWENLRHSPFCGRCDHCFKSFFCWQGDLLKSAPLFK
jgi:hypothetical protein